MNSISYASHFRTLRRVWLCAALVLISGWWTSPTRAQEPPNAFDSATMPSPGHVILREQFRYYSLELDHAVAPAQRGKISDFTLMSMLNIGLAPDVSLSLRTPTSFRRTTFELGDRRDDEAGVGDITLLGKWRIFREDDGPLDSRRFSLLLGPEFRSGDNPFTSDSYDIIVGCAYTQIAGRHGFNGALHWKFTTNGSDTPTFPEEQTADALRYDLAYLYRLDPEEFTEESTAAWYAVLELNGVYETNGDNELLIAPGLMYEARLWTWELSVQLPTWQDVENRGEVRYAIITGLRFSF